VTVANPSAFFPSATAFLAPPNTVGQWMATADTNSDRQIGMSAALLDGKVLVAGGFANGGVIVDIAETYDPSAGPAEPWNLTGSMTSPRWGATATTLVSGKVLVAGGQSDLVPTTLNSSELYNPNAGTWSATIGSMTSPRWEHKAIRLQDGKVLVVGGIIDGSTVTETAEIYNPNSETWSAVAPMSVARAFFAISPLPGGLVLVTGGRDNSSVTLDSAEIYDPSEDTWTPTGTMNVPRQIAACVVLADDKVMVLGGHDGVDRVLSAEVYDPDTETWTSTAPMSVTRYGAGAALLSDGRVLVIGGTNFNPGAEVWNPTTGVWRLTGNMNQVARYFFETVALADGRVLAINGSSSGPPDFPTAEIFDVSGGAGTITATVIVSVDSKTGNIGLRLVRDPTVFSGPRYGRDDMSAYTVAGGYSLFMPSQFVYKA
jgi:hypothetical protein